MKFRAPLRLHRPYSSGTARFAVSLLSVLLTALTGCADVGKAHNLGGYGLGLTLPAKWHGRIYQRPGGLPILQTGDFALPPNDDDPGTKAMRRMSRNSILIVLLEAATGGATGGPPGFKFKAVTLPVRIRRSDFLPMFKGVPSGHAFARRLISTHGRGFMLWVQFGVRPAPAPLLQEANRVLATLRIAAS